MSGMSVLMWATVMSLVAAGARGIGGQEEAVARYRIPRVVTAALISRFPGAEVQKCTRAREGGTMVYDIEFVRRGRKGEADIQADGAYVNYELAIGARELPKRARAAIEKRYPGASLKEIMRETTVHGKREQAAGYEVTLATAVGKRVEVKVTGSGKIVEESGG